MVLSTGGLPIDLASSKLTTMPDVMVNTNVAKASMTGALLFVAWYHRQDETLGN
jgi:hypothetical protein